jgi:CTP:molybdopterin cytidylyltransferase MocA
VAWSLDAARASGLSPVVVVVGREADAVLAAAGVGDHEVVARNLLWGTGIASSLVAALRALGDRIEIHAVVVGLGDQPAVGADAYRRLARAYDAGARLAVATYAGVRGNPVLLARDHWDEALGLEGDEGARVLMRRHPVVEVPCDGTGEPTDVDTPHDLAALEARWRSPTDST